MLRTSSCPRRSLHDDTWHWITLYAHWREGRMWLAGGVSDQPDIYLAAMRLIDTWVSKLHG